MPETMSTIPQFGAREIIGIIITIAAIFAFLLSVVKLTFSKSISPVHGAFEPGSGRFQFFTKNLSVVILIVSGVLMGVMGTAVFAHNQQEWVYLGPGYGDYVWSFEKSDGSRDFKAGDIVKSTKNVSVRISPFGHFTGTVLKFLSTPEPAIIDTINKGNCVKILGFKSIGFNKVWMKINKSNCV
ncbi:MAG: hypothetical protein ACI9CO_000042 [Candidatus Azotimanducaceae bacterium]|jgi:hypothetical protein